MFKWMTTLSLVACLFVVGCGKESGKGGAGADKGATADKENPDKNTFTVTVPGDTTVTMGKQQEISVEVNRNEGFEEEVTIAFEAPEGTKITPDEYVVKKDETTAKAMLTVEEGATAGDKKVKVTGTPKSGENPVDQEFKLTIEAEKE